MYVPATKKAIMAQFNLKKAELQAIDYIGLHRKSDVCVGKHISVRTYNLLKKKHLIMDLTKTKKEKYQRVMLTYSGERVFTRLHPTSKYRIK